MKQNKELMKEKPSELMDVIGYAVHHPRGSGWYGDTRSVRHLERESEGESSFFREFPFAHASVHSLSDESGWRVVLTFGPFYNVDVGSEVKVGAVVYSPDDGYQSVPIKFQGKNENLKLASLHDVFVGTVLGDDVEKALDGKGK